MKILFSVRNFWFVRFFDSVLRRLAENGHSIHILAEQDVDDEKAAEWNVNAERLSGEFSDITYGWAPQSPDPWIDFSKYLRLSLDYLWFLSPTYDDAQILRRRMAERTPASFVRFLESPVINTAIGRIILASVLRFLELVVPVDQILLSFISEHRPDVIIFTPLITKGSGQFDLLKAAQRFGSPTILAVGSWDHLSSKAMIRSVPDRVLVWNRTQKSEAVKLHGIDADRVQVTGAQCFDKWFGRRASQSEESFKAIVGLRQDRPYILYVCSALFEGSPRESEFVLQWLRAVRGSKHERVRSIGVLIRPHPKRGFEWDNVDLSNLENVVLWPRKASAPDGPRRQSDYFESISFSKIVIGLNTSSLLEAGIIGRSVHTILLPEFRDNQEGTIHFRYLLDGGLLEAGRTLDEHIDRLNDSLGSEGSSLRAKAFIEEFVRPSGIKQEATSLVVEAIETIGVQGKNTPKVVRWWWGLFRPALYPVAVGLSGTLLERRSVLRKHRRQEKQSERARERALKHEEKARRLEKKNKDRDERLRILKLRKEEIRSRQRKLKQESKARKMAAWRASKRKTHFRQRLTSIWRRVFGGTEGS